MRSLIALVVHRRLVALTATLIVAVYGVYAFLNTAIEAYPDVTNVQVGVISLAPGLAPEEVERQVTFPLERALNGTPGLMSLRSESYFGLSMITMVFDDKTKSFDARVQVTQRLPSADLPNGVTPEMAPDNTPLGKIFYYRLNSDRHTLAQLRSEQEWTVARVLKQIQGVADVVSMGGFVKEFHIEVDPAKLMAHNLTLDQVVDAVSKSNQNVGGGLLRRGEQSLIIRGIGLLRTPRDIETIVLDVHNNTPVRVKDVARVVQSYTPRQGSVGMNDEDDIVEGIVLLKRDENPSKVLDQVHAKVDQINAHMLPTGMRIEPSYDRSHLVGHTLHTVYHNLLFGATLIVGVLWLFLRSLRGSLIVAVVIPLSLLVAFVGLHFLGMPANLISMGAIDFGIIVDGAVVLTEAIIHKARLRKPASRRDMFELIIEAAMSVAKPTLFAMAIVIAALIPVFSLESIEGRIFRPLAMTYTFALVGALVFALTLVPALCALLLRPKDVVAPEPAVFLRMHHAYSRWIARVLESGRNRRKVFAVAMVALLLALYAGSHLGTEFLPELDEGDAYVLVQMPPSISLEKGQELLRTIRMRLKEVPEAISVTSEQGRPEDGTDNETINVAKVLVRLKERAQWRKGLSKDELVAQMRQSLADIPGVQFNFAQPIRDSVEESTSGARGHVVLKVFGTEIETMRGILQQTKEAVSHIEGVVDLDLYRDAPAPQLHIEFNRDALARYGISMEVADTAVETALAGKVVTTAWEGERSVPVRVRLPYADRMDEARIREIQVSAPDGTYVPLHALASVSFKVGNSSIFREGNARYMALKFNVQGRDMGSVVKDAIAAFEKNVKMPEGYIAQWGGQWENQQRASERLKIVVPLSLLVVFVLLFSALGSARSASIILLTAPFVMIGGIIALHLTGIDLSISAAIGFIALLGQVALAGLLVLSAVENLRREGVALVPALVEGAAERMRSILMVALLGLIGLLPMALSTGVGSETQRPFASVVVGGMAVLPLVALFVLPVLYAWLGPRRMLTAEERDTATMDNDNA
ncbi:CusA/CzcA family heavy metal efflux RND transporter [Pigmentiphaga sp.]|uniref:efflux RND transporter permease subunit n=1 Tax=Pigmentiphaga sp. TaxID=1977564 RepID=UPI00128D4E54|nr:CusA/CzcA family heavy metal efflux RND transporter [Pigmentiphaga sp.]MPS26489.1 efflux RND transporter permease subunit [Alcaligenaceae bacterium SAGV5]MPS53602.1 efflux RND transporter permease subunit [Alcaligenaceae bacterium SAGV3]MPT57362.1 efflux RND transporter permease subunit [Alcaligenaceae bacterium]